MDFPLLDSLPDSLTPGPDSLGLDPFEWDPLPAWDIEPLEFDFGPELAAWQESNDL